MSRRSKKYWHIGEGFDTLPAPQYANIMTPLKAGILAPDFSLPSTPDQCLSLSELRGAPVVLVFYPADWSPVCGDQLALYQELLPEFSEFDAQIIGISVDGVWSHLAFSKDRKFQIPLLADFEPKGAVAKMYGVYDEKNGHSERALFVIDEEGAIRWAYLSPVGINPGADGILRALASFRTARPARPAADRPAGK
jgi:peroxiredoxin